MDEHFSCVQSAWIGLGEEAKHTITIILVWYKCSHLTPVQVIKFLSPKYFTLFSQHIVPSCLEALFDDLKGRPGYFFVLCWSIISFHFQQNVRSPPAAAVKRQKVTQIMKRSISSKYPLILLDCVCKRFGGAENWDTIRRQGEETMLCKDIMWQKTLDQENMLSHLRASVLHISSRTLQLIRPKHWLGCFNKNKISGLHLSQIYVVMYG